MTIRQHQVLMRLANLLGMFVGIAVLPFLCWFAVVVVGLPRGGKDSAGEVVMALAAIALLFTLAFGGGRLAIRLAQRWARAECPRCGQPAVTLRIVSIRRGIYECRACAYVHPAPAEIA